MGVMIIEKDFDSLKWYVEMPYQPHLQVEKIDEWLRTSIGESIQHDATGVKIIWRKIHWTMLSTGDKLNDNMLWAFRNREDAVAFELAWASYI